MIGSSRAEASARQHRGTIFVEDCRVDAVTRFPGKQYVLRLHAPETARRAVPGSFVHIQCDDAILMRRPLSIMRAHADDGWIEVLFKIAGNGLRSLGQKKPGDTMSLLGPIGNGFAPSPQRPLTLLIGGGVGIPPMIFLAERLRQDREGWQPLVLMGSEIPFPFELAASTIPTDWLPPGTTSAMPLLEGWNIASRLASSSGFPGVFQGKVTDLAREWLKVQSSERLEQTGIFACGPTPMLEAVARLSREFGVRAQVSLEEYMACGVGGCAGCTVQVETVNGPAMKRVCVDGPVFDAATVFQAA